MLVDDESWKHQTTLFLQKLFEVNTNEEGPS